MQTPLAYSGKNSVLSSSVHATEYNNLRFLKCPWEKHGLLASEDVDMRTVKMESQGLQY